ncbi:hypothetical protein BSF38_00718 [Paludisphaera borealis]|uniref:Acyltransferase 3 domain-containing protein n=2 Tax=Paludisphaera borealis TaxID=1387353 RepID=A0A1U7CK45_9BACT|nr:hypothetical protein BSF38_00718 [Paludisphaera borealis]
MAVGIVILFHLYEHWPETLSPLTDRVLRATHFGYTGVSLFFVLSGFCLSYSLLRREAAGRSSSFSSYMASRFHRIAPPYYISILLYLLVPSVKWLTSGQASDDLTWRQVTSHLMFLHGFREDTLYGICASYWTLAVEMQFYLVLPILYFCAKKFGVTWVVVAAALSSLAWALNSGDTRSMTHGVFLARWTEFALGIAVAFWFVRAREPLSPTGEGTLLGASGVFLASAAAFASRNEFSSNLQFGLGYALLLSAILSSSRRGRGISTLFERPWIVLAGQISYSLYLTHVFSQGKIRVLLYRLLPNPGVLGELGMILVTLITIWVGGWVFYQLVERHFLRSIDLRSSRKPAPEVH